MFVSMRARACAAITAIFSLFPPFVMCCVHLLETDEPNTFFFGIVKMRTAFQLLYNGQTLVVQKLTESKFGISKFGIPFGDVVKSIG